MPFNKSKCKTKIVVDVQRFMYFYIIIYCNIIYYIYYYMSTKHISDMISLCFYRDCGWRWRVTVCWSYSWDCYWSFVGCRCNRWFEFLFCERQEHVRTLDHFLCNVILKYHIWAKIHVWTWTTIKPDDMFATYI